MEWVKQYALYIAITTGIIVGAVAMWLFSPGQKQDHTAGALDEWGLEAQSLEEEGEGSTDGENQSDRVIIDMKGQIKQPGVYELSSDQRIVDAIQLAGGFLNEADKQKVNLAQKLTDEMVVYIPKVGEETEAMISPAGNANENKINLNQATVEQLDSLPGIGPSRAADIVAHRETVGSFQQVEDLKEISGIGDKTYEKLKDLITVD